MKQTVLISGASSGIGYYLAKKFAKNSFNLILIARREYKLNEMKEQFYKKYNVDVKVISKDLTKDDAVKQVIQMIHSMNIKVDILINNAGIGYCGMFHEIDIKNHKETIALNITSLTELTKFIAFDMVKRRKGKILNVASTGAYQPGPLTSVYYATKAYVLSFSEAIYDELKPYNINVSVVCPGTTSTEFNYNAGKGTLKNAMSAEKVAKIAYKGLMKNKRIIIPGFFNKISVGFSKIIPRRILAIIVRKIQYKAITLKKM